MLLMGIWSLMRLACVLLWLCFGRRTGLLHVQSQLQLPFQGAALLRMEAVLGGIISHPFSLSRVLRYVRTRSKGKKRKLERREGIHLRSCFKKRSVQWMTQRGCTGTTKAWKYTAF